MLNYYYFFSAEIEVVVGFFSCVVVHSICRVFLHECKYSTCPRTGVLDSAWQIASKNVQALVVV